MGLEVGCRCGKVQLALEGEPIIAAECHCMSCREAAGLMKALPGAPDVTQDNGGTQFVMYRKDRIAFIRGLEQLRAFRLGPERTTRRVVATCCNSPMFLEFKGGHWLSLYASLWLEATAPQPALRSQTGDRPADQKLDDSVASGGWATARFYGRLLGAWIAMGFKVPEIRVEGRELDLGRH